MQAAALVTLERPAPNAATASRATWVGRVLSALPLLFLTFDAAIKLFMMPFAVRATTELGFTESAVFTVGIVEAACLVLYLVPRTSILGAVFWIGYLGGAVATQVRVGSPLVTFTLFPIYIAVLLWTGLWLRDGRLRRIARTTFGEVE